MSKHKSYSYGAVYRAMIIFILLICLIVYVRTPGFLVSQIVFGICASVSIYNVIFSMLKKGTLVIENGKMTKINALFMKTEIVLSNYSSFKLEDGVMKKIVATNIKSNFIETLLYNLYDIDLDDIYKVIIAEIE